MSTREQLQDIIEVLSALDVRNLNEESRDEAGYIVNDVIISLEELMDLLWVFSENIKDETRDESFYVFCANAYFCISNGVPFY